MTEQTSLTQTVAARKALTLDEKIAKAQATLDKAKADLFSLTAQRDAAAAFANVAAGDTVVFTLGRAETKRTLTGSVIARGEVDGADSVKVIAGEGLNTAVYLVKVSALDAVNPVAVAAEEPVAETVAESGVEEAPVATEADVDAALAGVVIG